MRKNETCLCKKLAEMSTAQLDEKLQQELKKETPEEEVVLSILRVLEEREADGPVEITGEVSNAWEKYSERTAPPRKNLRKRMWIASVAAVAAVICVVLLAIPQVGEAESILDVFFRWTESVFEFFAPEQDVPKPSAEQVFQTDNSGLQQLYEQVAALGVTEPVVPMWVPEGYELTELKSTPMPDGSKVRAVLQLGDSVITLSYRVSADILPSQYEKEDSAVEAYECSDVSHFIMDNEQNRSVAWVVDGVECSVSTNLDKEELYKMIKSVYRRELS